jgi:cytoskeletal protein RodZ
MQALTAERDNLAATSGIKRVAAVLQGAREARGETLDAVARVTRIGKNYLAALEVGDLDKLPSQAYTRGFIRLYATHLGLSPEHTLAMLDASPSDVGTVTPDTPSPAAHPTRFPLPSIRSLALIVAVMVALGAAYILVQKSSPTDSASQSSRTDAPPAERGAPAPVAIPKEPPPESPSVSPPPAQPEGGKKNGIVLRLKAVSDGKIHITIDGSVYQDYDLVSGDIVEWKAEDSIRLDLENAASVEGELDGIKLAPFGEGGEAAHFLLKADGVHNEQ